MRHFRKLTACVLLGVMLTSVAIPNAYLTAKTKSRTTAKKGKEEVVYITTDATGNVQNVNVVNIFEGGNITDYGNYKSVKMLTTNDKINQNGDEINFATTAEKAYYQGTLEDVEIPWKIRIHYFMNGREYAPKKIIGKTGELEIHFKVYKNEKCKGDFFENYALQASFTFDTSHVSKIEAENATIANVGAKKQLTYTILPGRGIDTTIKANVIEFEMEEVAINGIKLNLNVDIDDKELLEKVDDIMDATKRLNEGVNRVYNGTDKLRSGSSSFNVGISALGSGISELDNGILSLQKGTKSMQNALENLNSKSFEMTNGSAQMKESLKIIQKSLENVSFTSDTLAQLKDSVDVIKNGMDSLYSDVLSLQQAVSYEQYKNEMLRNGLDIESVKAGNIDGIQSMNSRIKSLEDMVLALKSSNGNESQINGLEEQIQELKTMVQLLTASNATIYGTESYINGLSDSITTLQLQMAKVKDNYESFSGTIYAMADSLGILAVNMTDLRDGVSQLVDMYSILDSGITQYTNGVAEIVASYKQVVDGVSSLAAGSNKLLDGAGVVSLGANDLYKGVETLCNGASELAEKSDEIDSIQNSIGGEKTKTVSFVSGKNKQVDSVRFIITTAPIEKRVSKVAEEVESEKKAVEDSVETESFWQKLLHLFGISKA